MAIEIHFYSVERHVATLTAHTLQDGMLCLYRGALNHLNDS